MDKRGLTALTFHKGGLSQMTSSSCPPAPTQLLVDEDRPIAVAVAFNGVAGYGPDPVQGLWEW